METDNGEDMRLYIEKLEDAKKIAKNQEAKGTTLSTDNVISIATTMFISAQQKISRRR